MPQHGQPVQNRLEIDVSSNSARGYVGSRPIRSRIVRD